MRRVWGFLSDPTLHLMLLALFLVALAVGSSGSSELPETAILTHCAKCRTNHYVDSSGRCPAPTRVAQHRP